jgi:sugar phosphate permease
MTTPSGVTSRLVLLLALGFCSSPVYYIPESVFATSFGANYTGTLLVLIDAFGYLSAIFFDLFVGPMTKQHDFKTFFAVCLLLCIASFASMTTFYVLQLRHETGRR